MKFTQKRNRPAAALLTLFLLLGLMPSGAAGVAAKDGDPEYYVRFHLSEGDTAPIELRAGAPVSVEGRDVPICAVEDPKGMPEHSAKIPDYDEQGKKFNGWYTRGYTDFGYLNSLPVTLFKPDGEGGKLCLDLYAHYIDARYVTVSFYIPVGGAAPADRHDIWLTYLLLDKGDGASATLTEDMLAGAAGQELKRLADLDGKRFVGWAARRDAGAGDVLSTFPRELAEDTALYAVFEEAYRVEYYNWSYPDGGEPVLELVRTELRGPEDGISAPGYAVNNFNGVFAGQWKYLWYGVGETRTGADAAGGGNANPPTGDVTALAPQSKHLVVVPDMGSYFTVAFDSDGGSVTPPVHIWTSGAAVPTPSPAPQRGGYAFEGWYLVGAGGVPADSPYDFSAPVTGDITLRAKWRLSSTSYTVVYWVEKPDALAPFATATPAGGYDPMADPALDPGENQGNYRILRAVSRPIDLSAGLAALNGISVSREGADEAANRPEGSVFRHISVANDTLTPSAGTAATDRQSEHTLAGAAGVFNASIAGDTVVNVYYRQQVYTLGMDFLGDISSNPTETTRSEIVAPAAPTVALSPGRDTAPDYYIYAKREQSLTSVYPIPRPGAASYFDGWRLLVNGRPTGAYWKNPFATFDSRLYGAASGNRVSVTSAWANNTRRLFAIHYMLQNVGGAAQSPTTTYNYDGGVYKLINLSGSYDAGGYFNDDYTEAAELARSVRNLRQDIGASGNNIIVQTPSNADEPTAASPNRGIFVPEEPAIQILIDGFDIAGTACFTYGDYFPLAVSGDPAQNANSWYGAVTAGSDNNYNIENPVQVYVYYNRKSYPLTVYKTNASTNPEVREDVPFEASIGSYLETPEMPGYSFAGWFVDEARYQPYQFNAVPGHETDPAYGAPMPAAPLALYAKWAPLAADNKHTVQFYSAAAQDASLIPALTKSDAPNGQTYVGSYGPLPGYVPPAFQGMAEFEGWYERIDAGDGVSYVKYEGTKPIYTDIQLYAKYTWKYVKVVFMKAPYAATQNAPWATYDVRYGSSFGDAYEALPLEPRGTEMEGQRFLGWFYENGGGRFDEGRAFDEAYVNTLPVGAQGDRVLYLYPKYPPDIQANVIFHSVSGGLNGTFGGTVTEVRRTVAHNQPLVAPGDIILPPSGYVFLGWASTEGWAWPMNLDYAFNIATTPREYWAVYKNVFTVTYDGNGNTGGTAPADTNGSAEAGTNKYEPASGVIVLGKGDLTNNGYVFQRWNTAADGSGTSYNAGDKFPINENTTLYAQWTERPTLEQAFTVTYNGNGNDSGTAPADTNGNAPSGTNKYASGSEVTVLGKGDLTNNGYVFQCWNTAADGSGTSYSAGGEFTITEDTTLYAQWTRKPALEQAFTVTYDGNGNDSGTAPVDTNGNAPTGTNKYASGRNVTVLGKGDLAKDDQVFQGWNTEADGSGIGYSAGLEFTITGNVTLYAIWGPDEPTDLAVTITYDGNGHTDGTVPVDANGNAQAGTNKYEPESPVTVLGKGDLEKDGYVFQGWNTAANGSGTSYGAGGVFTITENTTLYAQWTERPTLEQVFAFTVTYNGNGHTSGTATVDTNGNAPTGTNKYASGSAVTVLTKGAIDRSGYTFQGWNTKADGTGTSYAAGGTFNIKADTTLYAQWRSNGPGTGPGPSTGGGGTTTPPPTVTVEEEEPPLASAPSIFISDHVAYVIGYPDGTVRPKQSITRGEVTTVLYRLLLDDVRNNYWMEKNPFPDVTYDRFYFVPVSVMSEMGVVKGYPEGDFRPNGSITRAELSAVIARFARLMALQPKNDLTFTDIEKHWAETDILLAASIGWLKGDGNGLFRPNDNITRAEFIAIMNRVLERGVDSEEDMLPAMIHWVDNADKAAWYYFDVQEATNSHDFDRKTAQDPTLGFALEHWKNLTANRDWAALEAEWKRVNSHLAGVRR
ncbi:MAG: InlB B-repeat-containing protein [Clostridiales Family XIII bacterium]|jgi:uncharacterized repeat protein (TIGR02543 family)|nr:InlB B-repeat-containing protein [Clostridiales Family XIII bacterium]